MSSLSKKLEMFQDEVKKEHQHEELDLLDSIPLSRLNAMPIAFGKAKVGQTFEEVLMDQSWTKWFVKTYENSPKLEHRQFLRYVSLKVEDNQSSKGSAMPKKMNPNLCPSAQTSSPLTMAQPVTSDPWDAEEHHLEEILARQDLRMTRIEQALSSITQHLESQASMKQEPQGPWTMVKEEPQ